MIILLEYMIALLGAESLNLANYTAELRYLRSYVIFRVTVFPTFNKIKDSEWVAISGTELDATEFKPLATNTPRTRSSYN